METLNFDTARAFLEHLRPSNDHWWDNKYNRRNHVFRGHSDASWGLIPAGWRPLEANPAVALFIQRFEKLWAQYGGPPHAGTDINPDAHLCKLWRFALSEVALQFVALGRRIGLDTPWDYLPTTQLTREQLKYSPHALPLGALSMAQHHGIPTQLLDWTEDPLTAAYFALGSQEATTDLCVWALRSYRTEFGKTPRITLSPASNLGNPYIRAQSGVFMAAEQSEDNSEVFANGAWVTFDRHPEVEPHLKKLVLKASGREDLRVLLLRELRSEAHLKPSWGAAAETLMTQWSSETP